MNCSINMMYWDKLLTSKLLWTSLAYSCDMWSLYSTLWCMSSLTEQNIYTASPYTHHSYLCKHTRGHIFAWDVRQMVNCYSWVSSVGMYIPRCICEHICTVKMTIINSISIQCIIEVLLFLAHWLTVSHVIRYLSVKLSTLAF